MKAKLCRCNKCDTIMVDENPGKQTEFPIPDNAVNMAYLKEVGDLYYWGCPVCKTDANLIDITDPEQLTLSV